MKNLKIQFPLINLKKKNRISLEISIEKREKYRIIHLSKDRCRCLLSVLISRRYRYPVLSAEVRPVLVPISVEWVNV